METIIGCTTRPYNTLPHEEAFARIAAAGYRHVAVFRGSDGMPVDAQTPPAAVAAVRAAAAAAGLVPSMLLGRTRLDLGLDGAVDDYRRLIDNAAALGAIRLLDCGIGKPTLYEDYFTLMRRCAPDAEAAGVQITMKPHGGISLTVEDLLAGHAKVDHPAFGICFDPGNIVYYTLGERRPEPDAPRAVPVCNSFIIKDCAIREGKADVMVTAGDGLVDFPRVIGDFARGGFRGPYYVECVGGRTPAAVDRDIAFTLGYVRGILAACRSNTEP
ncbi:MAG: sugar phosphate isomerase/epimerase [Lentisphaeria bacterium]|nr:sugar phosphate isomerase/epimerase [Lentisphaeria bacterium]